MDISNFIPKRHRNRFKYKETKKITSNTFLKENTLSKFVAELSKIPANIFRVDDKEKHIYKNRLSKITDFEEGNMKFFAYCFLISRFFNFDYQNMLENFEDSIYTGKLNIIEIYDQFFSSSDEKDNKPLSFLDFMRDVFINCYVIINADSENEINEIREGYDDEKEEIDEISFEQRKDMFNFL